MRWILAPLLAVVLSAPASAAPGAADEPLDRAIDRAIDYLANSQNGDGGWSTGRTRVVRRGSSNCAISSLAVMAFLAAGHTPGEGPYGDLVEQGVRYVLDQQHASGLIATSGQGHQEMYHHGISTLMLAEVVGMTDGAMAKEVRQRLEKAVGLILRAQRRDGAHRGGWRYGVTGSDSDISVTGWQLMALRAAKNVGCDVPTEAIDRAVEFIRRCYDGSSGGYRYMPGAHVTLPCTGTSVLALELCGKDQHRSPEALRAGSFILKQAPHSRGQFYFYGVYYCSQAMFQLGENYWKSYREILHGQLLRSQAPDGSWAGQGSDSTYGPSYCTAMAVLALAVEYRFLPIYQRGEESPGDE